MTILCRKTTEVNTSLESWLLAEVFVFFGTKLLISCPGRLVLASSTDKEWVGTGSTQKGVGSKGFLRLNYFGVVK